jgi:lysophospholipase L1-like esterase
MILHANDRILFTGDSITDHGRSREDNAVLGTGYVSITAAHLQARLASPELKIFNRGISGNRVRDLLGRVEADLLALKPTVVSILIGINDVWRRYDGANDPTDAKTFDRDYRALLKRIQDELDARIVLLEPFLLHVPADKATYREDLNPKIDVVRQLALDFKAELLPLDGLFAQVATQAPPIYWCHDGVHPTPAGNALIAETWLENVGLA